MTLYEVSTHKIFFLTKFLPVTDDIICFFAVKLKLLKQMWVGWKFSCFYKVFLELILSFSYFHECTNIIIVMIKILFQDKNYKLYS